MFDKKIGWYISCSTGCTCCSDENFYQGFYDTREEAQGIIDEYYKGNGNPLASQYAKYGRYSIYEIHYEELPDGRIIVHDKVFERFNHNVWH